MYSVLLKGDDCSETSSKLSRLESMWT